MNLFNNRPSLGRKLHLDCFSDLVLVEWELKIYFLDLNNSNFISQLRDLLRASDFMTIYGFTY